MLTKTDIEEYFTAEKQESLVFLVIGIVAIAMALIFYFGGKSNFYKGVAIPLLLLGIVQAIAGYSVYTKSDDQRISNVYALDMNPDQLKTVELTRMRKVKTNFKILRWVEVAAVFAGLILILLFRMSPDKTLWLGLGIAFMLMSGEFMIADYIAGKRASVYLWLLEDFNQHGGNAKR